MSAELWGLFASAFVASTLFPGGSEILLVALAVDGANSGWTLVSVATVGNTLGAMTTYVVGLWLARRWPARELVSQRHRVALDRVRRYGRPLLLVSWLPIGGDALCLAAGWLRLGWLGSLLYIAVGKALRYAVLLGMTMHFAP
ncbi:MAG: DedA family protein [Gammaproteobacteria bacterium]|nr:DedA family protein [Gammaproteobacteria bacterium]MCP5135811.1 DedA family protein [Gammaproteobacteria bacterium]